ncbi:MAG: hypothetical protein SGILL_001246 [Bacillariaceae sp.]
MSSSKSKSSSSSGGCCNSFLDLENLCTTNRRDDDESVVEEYVRDNNKNDSHFMAEARAKVQAMMRSNYLTAMGVPAGVSAMDKATADDDLEASNKKRDFGNDATKETAYDTDESSTIQANILMISGCEDKQTSADVSNVSSFSLPDPNGRAGLTFVTVLKRMRTVLSRGRYSQIPQLTSSQPIDLNQDFYLVPPNSTGTRRAVLIGINYEGQSGELSGCHNDCLNMKDYIMNEWGFEEQNIVVLMDDGQHSSPTRSNMLSAYRSLAASSASGDAVFCHYSGK